MSYFWEPKDGDDDDDNDNDVEGDNDACGIKKSKLK